MHITKAWFLAKQRKIRFYWDPTKLAYKHSMLAADITRLSFILASMMYSSF